MLTKANYEMIADSIKRAYENARVIKLLASDADPMLRGIAYTAQQLAATFQFDNARFDPGTFLIACGVQKTINACKSEGLAATNALMYWGKTKNADILLHFHVGDLVDVDMPMAEGRLWLTGKVIKLSTRLHVQFPGDAGHHAFEMSHVRRSVMPHIKGQTMFTPNNQPEG